MAGAIAMNENSKTTARFCGDCGQPLSGRYCAHCGADSLKAAPPTAHAEGWSALASDFLEHGEKNSMLSVVASFARHPVETILRLTDDTSYRGHWAFLSACLAAQFTLSFVLLPRILSWFYEVPVPENKAAVVANEILQYVGIAILTPIQYYVCRALGTIPRTPRSYVKLCALSVGYGSLLSIASILAFLLIGGVAVSARWLTDTTSVGQALTLLVMLGVVVFVTLSHRRFWGMSWPVASAVTVAIALLSWVVVYPLLMRLWSTLDVTGKLAAMSP